MAENYGNPTVFLQPTNRKHIPLNGQFGLASSDYMYGIQRPEFSQCNEDTLEGVLYLCISLVTGGTNGVRETPIDKFTYIYHNIMKIRWKGSFIYESR